jgi:RNA polymerase sigma-70 factor (ECF subfamily)
MEALIAAAKAAWPELDIPSEDFAAYMKERSSRLDPACVADLYLAAGCVRGIDAAVRAFEKQLLTQVPKWVRRIDASPAFAAEVQQHLRVKLLVAADGAPPRIAQFAGACPLSAWLRLVAVREALMVGRKVAEAPYDPQDLANLAQAALPTETERDLVRLRFQREFQAALEASLGALDAKERNLLRLHYLDKLSIDQLAPMFRAHRSTVARWIGAAHDKLLAGVRDRLQEQLGLTTTEFHSLAGMLVSGLHISMTRALGDTEQ